MSYKYQGLRNRKPKDDLRGKRFGRLTAVEPTGLDDRRRAVWLCRCACGKAKEIVRVYLVTGQTKSCGCLYRELTTHGMFGTPTYKTWEGMLQRCRNKKSKDYPRYGGRGIKACARWYKFENFLADMGKRPDGLSLDRIDNSLGYSPRNCRWATQTQQHRNKRNNRIIEFRGKRQTLSAWIAESNLNKATVEWRLANGWPFEKAISQAPTKEKHNERAF